jgi:endonuclease YncB( thermonuclease family)
MRSTARGRYGELLLPVLMLALAGIGARVGVVVAGPSAPTEIAVTAVEVPSGDTIVAVDESGKRFEIRLADIGAPQDSQYHAPAARNLLLGIVEGKRLRVEVTGARAPGRLFGRVYAGKLDVNLELVRRGAAWMCIEYALDTSYLPYESDARRWRRGLWAHTWEIDARIDCRNRPPAERPVSGTRPGQAASGCESDAKGPASVLVCDPADEAVYPPRDPLGHGTAR